MIRMIEYRTKSPKIKAKVNERSSDIAMINSAPCFDTTDQIWFNSPKSVVQLIN